MTKMRLIEHEQCTGCMSCLQACPRDCITIEYDSFGSCFPKIDSIRCVDCEKCRNACPLLNTDLLDFNKGKHAYVAWSLDNNSRQSSTSGGAATEFYRYAIKNNYWICGTVYNNCFQVEHILSRDDEDIKRFKQSKYVFSDSSHIYSDVKNKLDNNEKVLFISLPCKVAGLLSHLGKKYKNLITVDIICHGTPPYKYLRNHIEHFDKKTTAKNLRFRQDNEFMFSLTTENGKRVYESIGRTDTYLCAFLEELDYRENCYSCPFAQQSRISDITIGDFWGLGDEEPFDQPYTGAVSLVITNTIKGQSFFELCSPSMFVEERKLSEAINGNSNLNRPSQRNPKRDRFIEIYKSEGFEKAVCKTHIAVMRNEKARVSRIKLRRFFKKAAGIIVKKYRS